MKIASWNVNSIKVRLAQVLEWLQQMQPDVLALQEIKMTNELFPTAIFNEAGYHVITNGQKTYNGVAFLTKQPALDIVEELPYFEDTQRRLLGVTYEGIRLLNLYVPNGAAVGSDKFEYKLRWLQALQGYVKHQLVHYKEVILMGDFNIAPTDQDVHDPKRWEGSVLVSPPEREALRALMELGLEDTLRLFDQTEGVYSWWDYREGAFRRNNGLRIDLILANSAAAQRCQAAGIDKNPRGVERPSDHAPVWLLLQ